MEDRLVRLHRLKQFELELRRCATAAPHGVHQGWTGAPAQSLAHCTRAPRRREDEAVAAYAEEQAALPLTPTQIARATYGEASWAQMSASQRQAAAHAVPPAGEVTEVAEVFDQATMSCTPGGAAEGGAAEGGHRPQPRQPCRSSEPRPWRRRRRCCRWRSAAGGAPPPGTATGTG